MARFIPRALILLLLAGILQQAHPSMGFNSSSNSPPATAPGRYPVEEAHRRRFAAPFAASPTDIPKSWKDGDDRVKIEKMPQSVKIEEVTSFDALEKVKSRVHKADKFLLVDFYTDWCDACRKFAKPLREFATKYADHVVVVKVDCEKSRNLAKSYKINAYPTMLLFMGAGEISRHEGADSPVDAFSSYLRKDG